MQHYLMPNLLNDNSSSTTIRTSFGHCMYNYLAGLLFSKKIGVEFIHNDLTNSSQRFNKILNLKSQFKTKDQIKFDKIINIPIPTPSSNLDPLTYIKVLHNYDFDSLSIKIKNIIDSNSDSVILFTLGDQNGVHLPGSKMISESSWIIKNFQDAYWAENSNRRTIFSDKHTNVAIHIRRGDVVTLTHPDRWKDNNHYVKIINDIKQKKDNCRFYIFSEGTKDDFKEFYDLLDHSKDIHNLSLEINNEELFNTNFNSEVNLIIGAFDVDVFHQLCSADICVTGQSSFSTLIAYINKNKIIYTPCLSFTSFENFDENRFIKFNEIIKKI